MQKCVVDCSCGKVAVADMTATETAALTASQGPTPLPPAVQARQQAIDALKTQAEPIPSQRRSWPRWAGDR